MGFLTDSTHFHIATWVIAIILFLVAALGKSSKGIHMTLRLFYILIIISGGALFYVAMGVNGMLYGIKFLLGILTIGMMEMVLVKKAKNKPTNIFWILFALFLFATLTVGFYLPLGSKLF